MVMNTKTRKYYNIFRANHVNKRHKIRLRNVTMRSYLNRPSYHMKTLRNRNNLFPLRTHTRSNKTLRNRNNQNLLPFRTHTQSNKTLRNNHNLLPLQKYIHADIPSQTNNISQKNTTYIPSQTNIKLKSSHSKTKLLNNILNHSVIKINKSKFTLKNKYVPGSGVGAISTNLRHLKKRFAK